MISWSTTLHQLFQQALMLYAKGERRAEKYFDPAQTRFLASIGARPIELFDFAEDQTKSGEPTWETVLLIQAARRDYFLHIQKTVWSDRLISMEKLPAKETAVEGIVWLPRIIEKAWAKLKGEMPSELMYGCGGDRHFSHENKVDLADFLRVVWAAGDDQGKIIRYVQSQRKG
jgi:hypothetical protein